MHPLVARIHPSYRTAIFAWLISRAALWSAKFMAPGSLFSPSTPFPDIYAHGFERGAPAWSAIVHFARAFDGVAPAAFGASGGEIVLAGLAELAMLAGLIAIYRFARRDNLPGVAERTTWLWACAPLMAWTVPVGSWSFGLAAVAISLATAGSGLLLASAFAITVAILFRPEALLLSPGLVYLGWSRKGGAPGPDWAPLALMFAPILAFTAAVGSAILLAGSYGVSLRTMQPDATWRESLQWHGLDAHLPELALAVGALVLAASVIKEVRKTHASWALMSVPCLVWPFLQEPSTAMMPALMLAIPAFGALARVLDDTSRERAILTASVAAMLLFAL
ncbi:MAG: hypothetical protein ACQEVA_18560 [Myxococcota bacterium]